jgi:hypothetical protein
MRAAIIVLISGILAGCSSGPYPASSPYFTIPAGSMLVLNQELTIPPNAARIYIQYGKVVSSKQKDDYYAHCWFESWRVLDSAQTIRPDTFTITRSIQTDDVVQRGMTRRYAMLDTAYNSNSPEGGGPMALVYSTEMLIHSDKQPDIRRFVCSHWENPDDARHLTVGEMQKALGNIATIKLNPAK